ncbi:MAG: hypothetical protein JWO31_200 [Phycisphaerales bacterium]|nr:hypothetical protein [Phycisphaerales bacterium]
MPDAQEPNVIEVPEPGVASDPRDVTRFVDRLVHALLTYGGGGGRLLYAELGSAHDLRWCVRMGAADGTERDVFVAASTSKGGFRTALARIGHHYMGGQLYGGASQVILSVDGRRYAAAFYMANDAWRGYWLRVYARRSE